MRKIAGNGSWASDFWNGCAFELIWGLNFEVLNVLISTLKFRVGEKEHVQLRFGVQNCPYFENSGPDWSKLGSLVK